MDELLGKLTNLTYEIFGVFLPGLIFSIFLLVLYFAAGPVIPIITQSALPELNSNYFIKIMEFDWTKSSLIILFVGWYFIGHILVWIGRFGVNQSKPNFIMLTLKSLFFRIPKPKDSFNANLAILYDEVQKRFTHNDIVLTWTQFFPVAKNFIYRSSSKSLITTYQNKYTLHRAIAVASVLLFWLSILLIFIPVIFFNYQAPVQNIIYLAALVFLSLVFIWNFSSSYMYHWIMFGNTIITEAYSLLYGPKNNESP